MGENTAETYMNDYDCNEGPFVYYNEDTGLYYSVVSIGSYQDGTYSLCQSIAYHPMGPWRKLALEEGGLVLTTNYGQTTDMVTGPGHNSFIKVGDEIINVYHKHLDIKVSDLQRGPATDRVVFVKNNTGIYVMHTNGPTTALQPKFYGVNGHPYDIISDSAIITTNVSSDKYNSLSYLNDNVISIHNNEIHPHINDFKFTSSSITINLKFDAIYSGFLGSIEQIDIVKDFVKKFKTLYFDSNEGCAVQIKSARPHGNIVLLSVSGIDTVEAAQKMRGKILYMKRSDAKLPKGTWFIQELFDCTVIDNENGKVLGTIVDVSETGANDVWHIKTPKGDEVLIPAIKQVVRSVDVSEGIVKINVLKGLFDDEN